MFIILEKNQKKMRNRYIHTFVNISEGIFFVLLGLMLTRLLKPRSGITFNNGFIFVLGIFFVAVVLIAISFFSRVYRSCDNQSSYNYFSSTFSFHILSFIIISLPFNFYSGMNYLRCGEFEFIPLKIYTSDFSEETLQACDGDLTHQLLFTFFFFCLINAYLINHLIESRR